jgi:hypothetical protein
MRVVDVFEFSGQVHERNAEWLQSRNEDWPYDE